MLAAPLAHADDEVVLRNSHHTVKKTGYMDSHQNLDLRLDRLTKITVEGGFHSTVRASWVAADGGQEETWAAADSWTLRRGSRSVDLIDILVESAPDDQDLFLVDWDKEGFSRLRRAMRWYKDPEWAATQTAGKPVWRSGEVKYGPKWSDHMKLDRVVSMRVAGDEIELKYMGNPPHGPFDRTIPLEDSEIMIGLRSQPLRVHLQGLLGKGKQLQGAEFTLEQIIGGPMPERAAALPDGGKARAAKGLKGSKAAKATKEPPVRATFPEWRDTPTLNKLARDVTRAAAAGKLDPYVGGKKELRDLMRSILEPDGGALLVGDPGVGKTALIEGLAQMIADGTVPAPLRGKRIIEISFSALNSDTKYTGQLEDKVEAVLKELGLHRDEVITFIDEGHNLVGLGRYEGSDRDVANMIKGPLARGEMGRLVLATTTDEVEKFDEDKAFLDRFAQLEVKPPSVDDTVKILRARRAKIQEKTGVRVTDDALLAAAELGARVPERQLPRAAIRLLNNAVADAQLAGKTKVDRARVEKRFRARTGIEPTAAAGSERAGRVATLGKRLKNHVVGQEHAADTLGTAARRAAAGVEDEDRPQGAFLFAGPTGVGKTEMARALAIEHYGSKDALLRIDMSEYQGRNAVDDLIRNVTRMIRKRPHAVLLFDEGERASPAVHDVLFQIIEDGRLTHKGRTVSFKESIVVMTSNVGARERAATGLGFGNGQRDPKQDHVITMKALRDTFGEPFVNRWDEVINFNQLTRTDIERIVDLQLARVNKRLARRKMTVSLTPAARKKLAAEGYDPKSGARELRRVTDRRVRTTVADALLDGRVTDGDAIQVGLRNGKIAAQKKRIAPRPPRAR
ncbi:MAG TPA: ATP-dependent Clp protease ATP-binding subunit [Kofleriaceae bacterium]|nr:ATP-dependent Clp protease ATP-binding subunit [Kofleriaceae bacterium]